MPTSEHLHVSHPNWPGAAEAGESEGAYSDRLAAELERAIETAGPETIGAFIAEPMSVSAGMLPPPAGYFANMKSVLDRHGIDLFVDEVVTGFGRTGTWFASDSMGLRPDIIVLAKGIASGLPLGAMVARSELMTWPPGSHASTFGGNPISCAVALETIALLEAGLIGNAASVGSYLLSALDDLMQKHARIGEVRGKGLMIGVELVKDRKTKERAGQLRDRVVQKCFEHGLLVLGCGENTLRLMPPLIVTKQQAELAVTILDDVLAEIG